MTNKFYPKKKQIILDNGERAEATCPLVVSASRSTDIPAFYISWFMQRLKVGYSLWHNPFGGKSYVCYDNTKFIVFWSKNPKPLLEPLTKLHGLTPLEYIKEKGISCYIQYTLNDYCNEGYEAGIRDSLGGRIETFKQLVEKLGKGAVIWRFDPLILTDKINIEVLISKISNLGEQLKGYTEKLVFSFIDIMNYAKVKRNLKRKHINWIDWTQKKMHEFSAKLVLMNQELGWNYELATCGELVKLPGIEHNHCVDDRLLVRFGNQSPELMNYLQAEIIEQKQEKRITQLSLLNDQQINSQINIPEGAFPIGNGKYAIIKGDNRHIGMRTACGCMKSKDIGQYNTCPHQCVYCYANTNEAVAIKNWRQHRDNANADTIIGA
ncbi:DUF1848 domain-containing protein [Desulfovibrio sp. ZJ369]|uniref:DUF1848 domain-containing protein n=1 Tax=Desulfovibrio sp. ZJ369 TaxID=2709793 RepID=UPI0013EA9B8F|nr:DUF1848 domain-containing protein [Desulfovibrio sp. ZJ369]